VGSWVLARWITVTFVPGFRNVSRTACLISAGLLLVTFSATRGVSAASKNAPAITVKPSQITVRGSSVCGYVKTGKQKRASWQSGSRVSSTKFRPHSAEISFITKSLSAQNKALKRAKAAKNRSQIQKSTREIASKRARLAQIRASADVAKTECSKLTSIRYDTKGVVALAVVKERPKNKKKTAKKNSVFGFNTETNTELVGLRANGNVQEVVQSTDESTSNLTERVRVHRTYQAPDGSVVVVYLWHPDDCSLGRISPSGGAEECVLFRSESLAVGLSGAGQTLGGGRSIDDVTPTVQFDGSGGMYFTLVRSDLGCGSTSSTIISVTVASIVEDVLRVMPTEKCKNITTWTVSQNGDVIVQQNEYLESPTVGTYGNYDVLLWDGSSLSTLMEDVRVSANGLQSFSNGDVLIHLASDDSADTRWWSDPSNAKTPGPIYRFRRNGGLEAWWHHQSKNPSYATESITDVFCNCSSRIPVLNPLVKVGDNAFAIGRIGRTIEGSVPHTTFHVFRVYPSVERMTWFGDKTGRTYDYRTKSGTFDSYDFLAKTDDWFLTGGPSYLSWIPKRIPYVAFSIRAINSSTFREVDLLDPANPIGLVTIEAARTGDTAVLQGVRISDGKYMLGIFDGNGATPTLKWVETPTLDYQHLSILNRLSS